MPTPQLQLITHQQLVQMSFALKNIIEDETQFDTLISIDRGGGVLSRYLSDLLDLKIISFAMSSYQTIDQKKEPRIDQPLTMDLSGTSILLVDEICDSGKTFEVAVEHIQQKNPKNIQTCCLFVKPHSTYRPNYFVEETTKWVVFPYEIRETFEALRGQDGKIPNQIQDEIVPYFKKLGVTQEQIDGMMESR